ncbi:uncharacterized protein H6S33_007523 [Morchella sextelata]|uniref:uncharacterized protein n=1 Tax=Morchella sextelata TaxID=1174677 RepID=UPI001D0595CD|nr:uncharacterized protein H6S33_007523 [Morchella sextelata]KAH0603864.1 hypothetical protein H6S33_007523 [Morchella sextelata]
MEYAKKSKFTGAEVKSLLGITPAQWRNIFKAVHDYFVENAIASRTMATDEQWDEAVKFLLSYPPWNKFRCLLQQPEEKFSEALKEKERVAKSAKVKAAKKKETKGKATDTKGKGKQLEAAPIRSSTKWDKQDQTPLPDDEDEVHPDIDEFASLEDEAEKPRDKTNVGDETDDKEISEEANEAFSVKTRKVERASYLTDRPIGISTFDGHPYQTFSSLPGPYLSAVMRMVRGVQLDPETRSGPSDLPHPTIRRLVGSLVLDEEFFKTTSGQYRVYQPLPEQVIFLHSDKDVRPTPLRLSFPYFYGDWEVLMDNQLRIDRRASGIKGEETGTRWGKPTKRKRSEIVEVSDDADDNDNDDDADDDADYDKEGDGEGGGSSSRKKPRAENAREGSSSKVGPKGNVGGSSIKAAQKDDNDSDNDDKVREEDDDVADEEEEEEKDEEEEEEKASRRKKTKTPGLRMLAKTPPSKIPEPKTLARMPPSKTPGPKTLVKTPAQTTAAQRGGKRSRALHLFDEPAESPPYGSELEEEQGDLIAEFHGSTSGYTGLRRVGLVRKSERTTQKEMSAEEPAGEDSYVDGGPDGGIPPGGRGDESIDMEVDYLTDASASSIEVAKLQTNSHLLQFVHPQTSPAPTNINLPDLPVKGWTSGSHPVTRKKLRFEYHWLIVGCTPQSPAPSWQDVFDNRRESPCPTTYEPPLSSLPPQESQFQQSSSRDTSPSVTRNRESDANQPHDTFYASPGCDSESIRTSSGGTHPEAHRQLSELSRPASTRAPSEVIRSTDYASGSGGGYSGESLSQNLLAPVDPTDPNKTRTLRHRSLGQFDIELKTLIEKAGWHLTKETLFKNPMPSVLELASMVRNSWDFVRAGTDFPAELSTVVSG